MTIPRITPSFIVALLALVVASGGVGYAAGQITSAQIKDGTIQSRDVRDGNLTGNDVRDRSLTGNDVRDGSLARNKLNRACPSGHARAFGGCVRRQPYARSTYLAAVNDCNQRNGRLPTLQELEWIAEGDEFGWANGDPGQYEFSGSFTNTSPFNPIARDRGGAPFADASAQQFWHHCVISY